MAETFFCFQPGCLGHPHERYVCRNIEVSGTPYYQAYSDLRQRQRVQSASQELKWVEDLLALARQYNEQRHFAYWQRRLVAAKAKLVRLRRGEKVT